MTKPLKAYYGDIHNHCDISYGHGSLEDAYRNARLQLDFVSVTAHAHWPDLPETEARLAAVNAYHQQGFQRALEQWPRYRELTNALNADGEFTTLLSFEWHSLQSGDHNIYYKGDEGEIIPAADLEDMRRRLHAFEQDGIASFLIPHHIGYKQGYRGINWSEFSETRSPIAEIFSMHGSAESDEAPYPYLHTMGPRDSSSTMQRGLERNHVFGIYGSTDHHGAHPGSYGHGRLGVWANELSRDGIWDAIKNRRTWALTGDNIEVHFSINGDPMGSISPFRASRDVSVSVAGGDSIDYVELLHNNQPIHRWSPARTSHPEDAMWKIVLEVGWGELDGDADWNVALRIQDGELKSVEPRFRGRDIVNPQDTMSGNLAFSSWSQPAPNHLQFRTRSWRNPTIFTPATQGVSLEVQGDHRTTIFAQINDKNIAYILGELASGSQIGYLGGFLMPAFSFHRAASKSDYSGTFECTHAGVGEQRDWYYVRVRQFNGQWAWSSPIWVESRT